MHDWRNTVIISEGAELWGHWRLLGAVSAVERVKKTAEGFQGRQEMVLAVASSCFSQILGALLHHGQCELTAEIRGRNCDSILIYCVSME